MADITKLESELWEAADELRANSKLTSQQYCMPVLGLIFLRYACGRFKHAGAQIELVGQIAERPSLCALETAAAREARDRLLPKLMSGEIEVQPC